MLRSKINIILPIALALILPGIGIFSNLNTSLLESVGLWRSWLYTSLFLYILWHLLWQFWSISSPVKKIAWGAIVLVFIFLVIFIPYWRFTGELSNALRVLLGVTLFLAIQYALKAQENIANLLVEKEQIQTENYKVQLKAIRAQIDPHFLFNTLNTLRSMVRQQHANSEQFIISLSDFYRQTLKHNEDTILPLAKELEVLQSYLFVMKSRNEAAISIDVKIEETVLRSQLPVLALQTVVENCFKHNSMTTRNPLQITIKNTEEGYIEVCNNIQPKIGEEDSSGYGLDLLKKRYALLNVIDGVRIRKTPEQFCVQLKLMK